MKQALQFVKKREAKLRSPSPQSGGIHSPQGGGKMEKVFWPRSLPKGRGKKEGV